MKRTQIIQKLIDQEGYKSYLEIGVQNPNVNFNKITCELKVGVDPDSSAMATYTMPSDEFFSQNKDTFDIIFIDGLHEYQQVYKDITNALYCLADNGTIICHDMNPTSKAMQQVPRIQKEWTGDGWKAFVQLRTELDDVEMFVVDTDYGCGILKRKQGVTPLKHISNSKLTYNNLVDNRDEWLNLISVQEFYQKFNLPMNKDFTIYQFQPYALDGNYGAAINHYCELVPSDDDWIIISDYDVMCLTPAHMHEIKKYIEAYPDTGMFLPKVNRVKQYKQVYDMKLIEESNIKVHRDIAVKLSKNPISVTNLNIVISGYFMIFKKATWRKVGRCPDGLLGVDNRFSKRILKQGMTISLMDTMYCFHYYRFLEGVNYRTHLRK